MPHDEALAERVRELLAAEPDLSEKRMFGGLAFLLAGHMAVAVGGQGGLMVRCDPADAPTLLADPQAAPTEMRGREMTGWLDVDEAGALPDDALARWVAVGVTRVRELPPK